MRGKERERKSGRGRGREKEREIEREWWRFGRGEGGEGRLPTRSLERRASSELHRRCTGASDFHATRRDNRGPRTSANKSRTFRVQ